MIRAISPQQFAQLREDGKVIELIDVRTPVENQEMHVDIARNIPLDRLDPKAIQEGHN